MATATDTLRDEHKAVLFLGIVGFAKWQRSWKSDIPDAVYEQLIPQLDELTYP